MFMTTKVNPVEVRYRVEVGVGGWRNMRALAKEMGHQTAQNAPKDELIRFVCCHTRLVTDIGVENLESQAFDSDNGHWLIVTAKVTNPELLSKAAVDRYKATWPAIREPDPWEPKSSAEALFTLATELNIACESDHSDCIWFEATGLDFSDA
jgi:hypothetical protein